ncbi:MAG TPA: CPBP family intramembrane glutamic endopeptidase [Candidatus Eremiobacteraceae bacterium]|nr:CPBP family intramembrane glutamic endopeptidase [Candidatus Eremiobacteraceae bacterium]
MNISGREQEPESTAASIPTPAPDFSVRPSYVRDVFFGADGLRAGWGLAFYVAMFYPLQFVASRWAGSLELDASGLWPMMLEEFGVLLAAVLPPLLLARVEKRRWGVYGLPRQQAFGKLFWLGGVWGLAAITVLLAALYGLRVFELGHLAIHGSRIWKFAGFWAVFFLLVGFFEEFLLRGYTQFTLTRAIGFWPSAILLSCTFGLIHSQNAGEQWPGLLAAAVIGFFFCLTLRRTGTLWFAVGFHAAWDWGETFVYSVPDSGTLFPGHLLKSSFHGPSWITGGMVGPEGSVLCFLVIAGAWVLFSKRYPEVLYRVAPLNE